MENVNENDKLIAEFMGKETRTRSTYWEGNILRRHDFDEPQFYSTSWDWLMPVWVRFRDLKLEGETSTKLHTNYVARLAQDLAYGTIEDFHHNLTIAIKWFNQNK